MLVSAYNERQQRYQMLEEFPLNRRSVITVSLKALRGIAFKKDPELYVRVPISTLFDHPQDNAEIAVVHLAGFVIPFLGWRIKCVREAFPDALYEDMDGNEIRVEFEVKSSHFMDHQHEPQKCDYVICWQDNLTLDQRRALLSRNQNLRVLELRRFFHDYEVTRGV